MEIKLTKEELENILNLYYNGTENTSCNVSLELDFCHDKPTIIGRKKTILNVAGQILEMEEIIHKDKLNQVLKSVFLDNNLKYNSLKLDLIEGPNREMCLNGVRINATELGKVKVKK